VRVVIEPNIFISALIKPRSNPGVLLALVRERRIELVMSPALLEELRRVVRRPKFRQWFTVEEAISFIAGLERLATLEGDPPSGPALTRDPDDDYLVRLARSAGAEWLVSGDRDLLDADLGDDPVVVPPARAVDILDPDG